MTGQEPALVDIPDFCLVVLVGATGSGKSTFAARWFAPTETLSSDHCRGLVCDDETDQSVSADAFALVAAIAEKRLKHRRLAVIDATNVRASDRKAWIELARRWHALPVAIVLDPGLEICVDRNRVRPERSFGPAVPERMIRDIRRGLRGMAAEGFRQVWTLSSETAIDTARVERRPLWTDRRADHGPFDIIGDVHGCADELRQLLLQLGYGVSGDARSPAITSPHGRKLVFVGDLVDRGPATPEVLRIVMAAQGAGLALVVQGNHDRKLSRWLEGRKVTISHGLQDSIDQLDQEPPDFRERVRAFLRDLRSHYWLDDGRLAVAHAGLREEMIGRGSPQVRDFALFGETTGETDEFGLPVRRDWAAKYRGSTSVVYGHTPVPDAEWINDTICIDTGCVFGGRLSALRWPEREIVGVPALRVYSEPVRPLAGSAGEPRGQAVADRMLDLADISGRRFVSTTLLGRVAIEQENAAAALEAVSRFAVAPEWLVYLPPTMSPVETSRQEGFLERPEEAFAFYRERRQKQAVLQEKHMGSRACIAVCRDAGVALRRFGLGTGESGAVWTRTGRAFFANRAITEAVLDRMRSACTAAGLWAELRTDWLLLDAEIMPWSAKASGLIEQQYAPVADSSRVGLAMAREAVGRAVARGVDAAGLLDHLAGRVDRAERYARAWAPYVWPVASADDLRVAPFHVLASEGRTHFDKDHLWHMQAAETLAACGRPGIVAPRWRCLALDDAAACAAAALWWEELTASGAEGVVVKPRDFVARGEKGLIQPALKVRGREYLRIIYGPEYDLPRNLERLRERGLGRKQALALREFALGHEALVRFVVGAPLRQVHECVVGLVALDTEPVDSRL